MNTSDIKRPDWFFYPAWLGVSIVSILASWFASLLVIDLLTRWLGQTVQVNGQSRITEDFLFLYVFFPLLCLFSGVLQYALLRLYVPKMGGWIPATMVGCVLVFGAMIILERVFGPTYLMVWNGALGFASIGGAIGLSQWLFLRQRILRAGWWVLASVLGWSLAVLGRWTAVVSGSVVAQMLSAILPPAVIAGLAWWYLLRPEAQREIRLHA